FYVAYYNHRILILKVRIDSFSTISSFAKAKSSSLMHPDKANTRANIRGIFFISITLSSSAQ
ncbi:hypothetical protein, partial [Acinetobacter baumannii]